MRKHKLPGQNRVTRTSRDENVNPNPVAAVEKKAANAPAATKRVLEETNAKLEKELAEYKRKYALQHSYLSDH
jgi:hypothetical protein